jgi:hypothetical protein
MTRADRPPGRERGRSRRPTGTHLNAAPLPGHADTGSVSQVAGAGRELVAWAAAVEQLHALGLPAAVPEFPAAWLARRGIHADWIAA